MPRRSPSEHRRSPHKAPGRNSSARARAELAEDKRAGRDEREADARAKPRPPRRDVVMCPHGKTGYSEVKARELLVVFQGDDQPHRGRRPVRVYRCGLCSTPARESWHLTSEEDRSAPAKVAPPAPVVVRPARAVLPPRPPRPDWMR